MKAERRVEASEVSGPRRRVVTGILRDVEAPEPGVLRPLARTLVDLAIALGASDDKDQEEAS